MPTLKVRCPDCDANIRQSVDAVDQPTDVELTCPKCGKEFFAIADPEVKPRARRTDDEDETNSRKPAKAARRYQDDDDDDEDNDFARRRRRRETEADGANRTLLFGAIGGGVLLVAGIVVAVILLGGKKKTDTAQTNTPSQVDQKQMPPRPGPGLGGTSGGTGTSPNRPLIGNGGTGQSVPPQGNGSQGSSQPPKKDPPKKDPPRKTVETNPDLPPPPVIRISGSLAPTGTFSTPVEKPPPAPPLQPDEDPFVRAKKYVLTAQLPQLPKLPPAAQRPLLTLDPGGHSAFVVKAFVTPLGEQVITVGKDKAIRVWNLATGEAIRTIRLPAGLTEEGELEAAAMSPDGKQLAVAGKPLKATRKGSVPIFILNLETGTLAKTLNASSGQWVTALDFSNDGKRIAVGCFDGHVEALQVSNGSKIRHGTAHPLYVREVRYSPTPKIDLLATIGADNKVLLINLTPGRPVQVVTLQAGGLRPSDIAWSHDGHTLAVSSDSGEIMLFGTDGRLKKTLPSHSMEVKVEEKSITRPVEMTNVLFLPGDNEVACCGNAGAAGWAGIKNAETGKIRVEQKLHNNTMSALGMSADGKRVVSSGGNQWETYVWDSSNGKPVSRLCGSGHGMWSVGWAKDGKSIAYGFSNKSNPDGTRQIDFTFRFDDFGPGPSADPAKYNLLQQTDGAYRCERGLQGWGMGPANGQLHPIQMDKMDGTVYSATVLPGRRMVVAAAAFALRLFDPQSGRQIRAFTGHTGNVVSVAPSPDGKYFVTGSVDQTIRIWVPEQEEPVMSIFVGGHEWIAWTPQGFYACSGNGERLVAWQVNNGSNKLPNVYPAERFRPSMYQPALIKYLIPAGNMGLALAMAKHYDKALVQASNIADILPPDITLLTPEVDRRDVVVDGEKITVKASANGNKQPITAMRLLVDGRPFQGLKGATDEIRRFTEGRTDAEASWEVPVIAGPHSFAVIAESPVSKGMSKVAIVTRSGEPPRPNLYVLSMGISAYPAPNTLHYAASDAKLLAKTFATKSKDLFENVEIRTVTDGDATCKNIREGMDWLKSKMTVKDVGIVVFSGHGGRDPFSGKFYLIPVDMGDDMEGTCLSGDEFKSRLENMPGRLVAIIDACHSGSVADAQRQQQAKPDGLVQDLVSEETGVIVMCASLGREVSMESSRTKAGYYTLGLVEGMNGLGDIDQDGVVYINELDLYASARVKQLSGGTQNPTVGRPPSIHPFPIAKP